MELKTPKAKKKSNLAKLISWGRMFRTPLLILFLLGTTNCHDDSDIDVSEPSHLRHKHNHIQPNVNETIKNKLSDIKYLRRHLNKEIVNFVMTDYLVDGEIENRVHYNGITAKETYVGSDGRGLKLRQLTDGRHFVQVIYSQNGVVQDCEYVTRPKSARDFLKTLRRELKTALDEERFRMQHEDTNYSDDEKFLRHYRNVSFSLLMKNEALPREVANWLDYDQLKLQCLRRHEELRHILENQSQIPDNSIRFRACLKLADTPVSNMVGKLFFNVVQTKCFRLKPVKVCMQRSWWGKCLRRGYMKQAFLRDNLRY